MNEPTLNIDGASYLIDSLSEQAKAMVQNLQVTNQEISRLESQLAIAKTARMAYVQVLKAALPQA